MNELAVARYFNVIYEYLRIRGVVSITGVVKVGRPITLDGVS